MAVAGFLNELKRRKVFRVALVYSGVAWLLLQFADVISEPLGLPPWFVTAVLVLAALGFPIALILSWVFDITPEGVQRTDPAVDASHHQPLSLAQGLPVALIAILAISVGFLYLDRLRLQNATQEVHAEFTGNEKTIAVLPFVDMSEAGDQQYFGDGIAEELLNALVGVPGLQVAARTSSFSFHGKDVGVAEIGQTLGVHYVLEGSVRRANDQLRITAQLVETNSGFHLFSRSYQRQSDDIFEIQNEIAQQIVSALIPSLGVGEETELVVQKTNNLEAYKLRMKGRYMFFRATPETLGDAIDMIEQAIELDPEYWSAWGDLSYAYGYMAFQSGTDPTPNMSRSAEAAYLTLAHEPANVPGLLLRALWLTLHESDHVRAAEFYTAARAAGEDSTYWAYNIAWLHLGPLNRLQEAIELLKRAELKDPLASMPKEALAMMYLAANQLTDAEASAAELLALPGVSPSSIAMAGYVLIETGNLKLASEAMGRLNDWQGPEHSSVTLFRIHYYVAVGELEPLRGLLEKMLGFVNRGGYYSPYTIGTAYLELGDTDRALDWFGRALNMREPTFLSDAPIRGRRDARLNSDFRFQALLRRMNLPVD